MTALAADVTAPTTEAPASETPAAAARVSRFADTRYPPVPPATVLHLTTLEDAIAYRLWRLGQPCPDCGNDPAANRCTDHLCDLDLIVTYHKALRAAEGRREDPA